MNSDNRNLLLAVVLSMTVLFGWQMFIVGPEMEKEAAQQELLAQQRAADPNNAQNLDGATPQVTEQGQQGEAQLRHGL